MRLLLDATAVPADRGGVGRYVDHLLAALDRAGTSVLVACQARDVDHLAALAPGAGLVPVAPAGRRRPQRLAWEQTVLPRLVARARPDVVHSPHYTLPLRASAPVVVTLHDATPFTDPHLHTRVKGPFLRGATRTALRRAARLVVPSVATRDELVRVADADASRVDVVPHGVDSEVFSPPSGARVAALRTRLGLGSTPYVAFLGTLEPRKNVAALVDAWVRACAAGAGAHDGRDEPPVLVLAGGRGWDHEVARAVARVPPGLRVVRPGYLPLEELPALLGGAEVVAYPSLGEGFGLPVLEAMACGAAVLTTPRLALPEVGGDAVAYAEPDVGSLAVALAALLDDAGERARLRRAALARAATFTWDATAEGHLAVYLAAVRGAARDRAPR